MYKFLFLIHALLYSVFFFRGGENRCLFVSAIFQFPLSSVFVFLYKGILNTKYYIKSVLCKLFGEGFENKMYNSGVTTKCEYSILLNVTFLEFPRKFPQPDCPQVGESHLIHLSVDLLINVIN